MPDDSAGTFATEVLRDLRDDIVSLRNEISSVRQEVLSAQRDLRVSEDRNARDVELLTEKIVLLNKPNWVAIASAIAFAAFTLPAAWYIINAYVSDQIGLATSRISVNSEIIHGLQSSVADLTGKAASLIELSANSRSDRQQLNDRVRSLETQMREADQPNAALITEEIANRRTQYAATRVSLTEIETQFKSASDIANLRAVQQERVNSMIWQKVFPGDAYPIQMFFPNSYKMSPDGVDGEK